ncbi:HprK-related kinase A [uncultured Lamprocystis sp.]|uniref:HprK-related kinase A n=1 Tax=uncultured Lamprocystis sp. TaxID=543132 RepID=UPI0025D779F0|nr:HprK-related kinase A [uncultured Lamprocystis sp.]
MTLSELLQAPDRRGLADNGLVYRSGPFIIALRTRLADTLDLLEQFYGPCWASRGPAVAHFQVEINSASGIRRWWRAQAVFALDALHPFEPFPREHAFPLLEWGLNWSIATRAHRYLMLHAGALERNGQALLLPAMPGAGKSTLSAALAYRGWRLLSDEFGLIRPTGGDILPLPRAIPLKNRSIPVIREFLPDAFLGPVFPKTRKGDVAHLRPPLPSLARQTEPAQPRWIAFPRFVPGLRRPQLKRLDKSLGFARLAQNAFNYRLLGEGGFMTLVRLVRECTCFSMDYGNLAAAIALIEEITADEPC